MRHRPKPAWMSNLNPRTARNCMSAGDGEKPASLESRVVNLCELPVAQAYKLTYIYGGDSLELSRLLDKPWPLGAEGLLDARAGQLQSCAARRLSCGSSAAIVAAFERASLLEATVLAAASTLRLGSSALLVCRRDSTVACVRLLRAACGFFARRRRELRSVGRDASRVDCARLVLAALPRHVDRLSSVVEPLVEHHLT